MERLKKLSNVYIDDNDDYRNSLLHVDAIIVDRSSVMVEAATVGVPVLFMYNKDFREPMTRAIQPLIDSYYQGTNTNDMIDFIEMSNRGDDPKKYIREMRFRECIPYFDGKCGYRIKEEIIRDLKSEKSFKGTTILN